MKAFLIAEILKLNPEGAWHFQGEFIGNPKYKYKTHYEQFWNNFRHWLFEKGGH